MRGAVSMALAYNQVIYILHQVQLRVTTTMLHPKTMNLQFTRAGHTQLRGNAILITSTITVVLFSTVVCMKNVIGWRIMMHVWKD